MIEIDMAVRLFHFLGAVTAVGAVLSTDLINSYYFLHPSKFEYELKVEELLSLMIWAGLFVLSVTGTLMFLKNPAFIQSQMFQLKMLVVAVLFLNGVFLNQWASPRLSKINDSEETRLRDKRKFEIVAGISALISVTGWMTALLIGYF
ncbi:MAG: hypothetical protein ACI8Z7_000868 [Candidatus Nanohaloarchaea archaeon]|jgi:hypothetical protein